VNFLVENIVDGTQPLNLQDGTAVRDTVCNEDIVVRMFDPMAILSNNTKANGGKFISAEAIIALAVIFPAVVLLLIILAYRRRSIVRTSHV